MVIDLYWRWHKLVDPAFAATSVGLVWLFGKTERALFIYDATSVQRMAVTWLGPTLSLFGLFSATIAFMFTVIDKPEFNILRQSKSQAQLWEVFQGNLVWLCVAGITCLLLATAALWLINSIAVQLAASFVIAMVIISLVKFTWIMTQVVSVRIATARNSR